MKITWPTWWIDAGGVACLAALSAGAFALGVRPAIEARAQSRLLDQSARSAEALLQERVTELRGLTETERAVRARLDALPSARALSERSRVMTGLAELAREMGVSVRELSPREPRREARSAVVAVRLAGDCTLDQLRSFVAALYAKFPDVELASLDQGASWGMADAPGPFSMDLWWYAVAEDSGSAGAKPARPAGSP
ncbi:MAG: hypothetical protein DYG92_02615 [Leptolyngbya sp. PLA1]|nr:hypothetical protein [Leptolyngbya sp. PLA1]